MGVWVCGWVSDLLNPRWKFSSERTRSKGLHSDTAARTGVAEPSSPR